MAGESKPQRGRPKEIMRTDSELLATGEATQAQIAALCESRRQTVFGVGGAPVEAEGLDVVEVQHPVQGRRCSHRAGRHRGRCLPCGTENSGRRAVTR